MFFFFLPLDFKLYIHILTTHSKNVLDYSLTDNET